MKNSNWVLPLLGLALVWGGCASPMALDRDMTRLATGEESIVLLTLRMSNQYVPAFQPELGFIEVVDSARDGATYRVDPPHDRLEREYNEHLVSFQLAPGSYRIRNVSGGSSQFPIWGTFDFDLAIGFDLDPGEVVYVGHVELVNRERRDDEPRAGSLFPLIDQSVTGFSGGTFDVRISDRYSDDVAVFQETYPILNGHTVSKALARVFPPGE